MKPQPLSHVWQYTDADRAFWREHFEAWLPRTVIDAHVHITDPSLSLGTVSAEKLKQVWVAEVSEPITAADLARCDALVYPDRNVSHVAFGWPTLDFDLEGGNECARRECVARGWQSLALLRPQWTAERVAEELDKPGVIGLKPYYALISCDPATRDRHLEASIFDFLPHSVLEVLDPRGAWLTLHVPKADRLGHPDNIREIKEIRNRYPSVILVLAHFGRCYTESHAREAFPALADDPGLYFDNSAVLNPLVHRLAIDTFGPERILYGSDNPVFYMRGRRQWEERNYINRTNVDFYFNKERESPDIEAGYTLYMYEALKAIRQACEDTGVGSAGVELIFAGNAERLMEKVLTNTGGAAG